MLGGLERFFQKGKKRPRSFASTTVASPASSSSSSSVEKEATKIATPTTVAATAAATPNAETKAVAVATTTTTTPAAIATTATTATTPPPPTAATAVPTCWVCRVDLGVPQSQPGKEDCCCCYISYPHPLWDNTEVLVCRVCKDALVLLQEQQQEQQQQEETEVCLGCGDENAPRLFLCDGCNVALCDECVSRSTVNTTTTQPASFCDEDYLNLLATRQDPWYCQACCKNPSTAAAATSRTSNTSTDTGTHGTTGPLLPQQSNPERTVEDIVHELAVAETKKADCLVLLDHPDEQRAAIASELDPNQDPDAIDTEFQLWETLQLQHLERLDDFIATLQDELQVQHHVDMAFCYNKLLVSSSPSSVVPSQQQKKDNNNNMDTDTQGTDNNKNEPDWVRTANRAIQERYEQEQQKPPPPPVLPPEAYWEESYAHGVDELVQDDTNDINPYHEQGRAFLQHRRDTHTPYRVQPTPAQLQLAHDTEQAVLEQLHQPTTHIAEETDVQDLEQEQDQDAVHEHVDASSGARIRQARPRPTLRSTARKPRRVAVQPVEGTASATSMDTSTTATATAATARSKPVGEEEQETMDAATVATIAPAEEVAAPHEAEEPALSEPPVARALFPTGTNAHDPLDLCSSDEEEPIDEKPCIVPPRKAAATTNATAVSPTINSFGNTNDSSGSLCLCSNAVRQVFVHRKLVKHLKPHQREGIQFMWKSSFCDFESHPEGHAGKDEVGGCILAHNMGLGKTFTTIALLHTVLTHSAMTSAITGGPLIQKVLLVVPVNTMANWENEFSKWLRGVPIVNVINLSNVDARARDSYLSRWSKDGGVLLISSSTFQRIVTDKKELLQPHVLVLDEAHTMVKNATTGISKALNEVTTNRRILLTGSPFQNNLLEYYRMCEFIRPGLFGYSSEAKFEKEYVLPIMSGMTNDCGEMKHYLSVSKSAKLSELVAPYIDRQDVSALSKDLPPMSQVVLHVRQSRLQSDLYRKFQRLQKSGTESSNFFKAFSELRPIHNHPFCLQMGSERQSKSETSSSDEEQEDGKTPWWESICNKGNLVEDIESGYKIVLLLHILAYASKLGEKVLIFSQCLKTLDYLEKVLAVDDWKSRVPSLEFFDDMELGGWKKSRDYLRIDGEIHSSERGGLVDEFNRSDGGGVRAFLISSLAGGIGINLTAASRVVLVDSHFNPTVSTQSLFRSYRYGQTRPLFCYRLLTEGTIEEKVYSRSVNKTGLALRVIDRRTINKCFSKKEIADLQQSCQWVQCDKCEKWRMLLDSSEDTNLPEKWFCEMNSADPRNNKCSDSEKDQRWYEFNCNLDETPVTPEKERADSMDSTVSLPPQGMKDIILDHLLKVSESKKNSSLISRHYFHEAMLESSQDLQEVEEARQFLKDCGGESDGARVTKGGVLQPSLTLELGPTGNQTILSSSVNASALDGDGGKSESKINATTMSAKKPSDTAVTAGAIGESLKTTSGDKSVEASKAPSVGLSTSRKLPAAEFKSVSKKDSPKKRRIDLASPSKKAKTSNMTSFGGARAGAGGWVQSKQQPVSAKKRRIRAHKMVNPSPKKGKSNVLQGGKKLPNSPKKKTAKSPTKIKKKSPTQTEKSGPKEISPKRMSTSPRNKHSPKAKKQCEEVIDLCDSSNEDENDIDRRLTDFV